MSDQNAEESISDIKNKSVQPAMGTQDTVGQENDEEVPDMSLFASVWVKVEVEEALDHDHKDENSLHKDDNSSQETDMSSSRRRKRTRPQKIVKSLKIFKCDSCEYTTTYKNSLRLHNLSHSDLKPYNCDQCTYVTKYTTSLQRHIKMMHDQYRPERKLAIHSCEQCTYTSKYKSNLKAHKRKHKSDKEFVCSQCPYKTSYRHNYMKHSRTHIKSGPHKYKCDKCPFVTKFEGHITRHLAKIHNEVSDTANRCDLCDFSTKVRWRLNTHKHRSKHDEVIKCIYCPFETFYKCEAKKHKVSHYSQIYVSKHPLKSQENVPMSEESSYVPNISDFVPTQNISDFAPTQNISDFAPTQKIPDFTPTQNILDFSPTQNVDFELPQTAPIENIVQERSNCMVESDSKIDWDKLQVSDSNKDKYYDNTTLNYTSQNTITNEVAPKIVSERINHFTFDPNSKVDWNKIPVLESNNKEKPFQCTMCTYAAKYKACVQRHFQRLHTGTEHRPYKCMNCDFSTKTKDQISLHNKRSQSENMKMFCRSCDFSTFFKCQYVMHQRLHYAHKCTVCDYSCKNKYEITKHYSMVHLGNGFKCRFCDYKAFRAESLQCHETVHTGEKPFKCDYCSYTSVRKSLLVNHMKRYHSDVEINQVVITDSKIQSLKIPVESFDPNVVPEYFNTQ